MKQKTSDSGREGGGVYSQKNWVGLCGPLPKIRNNARLILREKLNGATTVDSFFDLVGSRQHGVASYEIFSWSADIHILTKMVMTSDETQMPNPCQLANVTSKTRDKGQLEKSRISCRYRNRLTADRHKLSHRKIMAKPSFTDPTFTGSIFVCGPLHHHVLLFNIGEVWNPVCCHGNKTFTHVLWSTFSTILMQRIKHF